MNPLRRLLAFFRRSRLDREMAEEMAAHLERETEQNLARGLPPDEARYAARRSFGGIDQLKEHERDARGLRWLEDVLRDVRFAVRQLARSPGFTAAAVLTLALGIGANTAIFSALDAALLRPLPYPQADRLVQVFERRDDGGLNSVAGGVFLDWRAHQRLFDSLTLVNPVMFNLRGQDSPMRLNGLEVSHEFFRVFGVQPELGRGFLAADNQPGGDNNVVVLADELWRSRLGANPSVLGTAIILDDVPRTVIGIAPSGAWPYGDVQYFVPAVLSPNSERSRRVPHWAQVYGRLKPGVSVEQGNADLNSVKQSLQSQYPVWKKDWSVGVLPLAKQLSAKARPALLAVFAACTLVLVIACANIANLLLARARNRRQEISLRAALGASTARLIGQVLTESLVLAALGGGLGVMLSFWSIGLLRRFTVNLLPHAMAPAIDGRMLGFAVMISVVTGVLFGLIPAWQVHRTDLNDALKRGGHNASAAGSRRTQASLIVAEVALTVVLLAGAGLLFRSLVKTASVDLGFEPRHALAFDLSLPTATYRNPAQRLAFTRAVLGKIRAIPGVEAAGTGLAIPLAGGGFGEGLFRPGEPRSNRPTRVNYISGGYLEALGARLLAGRRLDDADNHTDAARVMVVNQTAVQAFFPNENPLGSSLSFNGNTWTIIGVIADLPDRQLDAVPQPWAYCAQAFETRDYSVVVRTPLEPVALVPAIRDALRQVDPGLPPANIRTLDQMVSGSLTERRLVLGLIGAFAATALLLACIGLYGVIAYAVSMRHREFSIRVALGAKPRDILCLVLSQGGRLVGWGLLTGLAGTFVTTRAIQSMLFGTSAHDPLTLAATMLLLAAVCLLACWLPARRATKVDPIVALRAE